MAKMPLTVSEALQVSAEARALLSAAIGPEDQTKVKKILGAALDAMVEAVVKPEKPAAKAEKK